MKARIFSIVGGQLGLRENFVLRFARQDVTALLALLCIGAVYCAAGNAQAPTGANGLLTDPQTGIVYRKVSKVVERPVIESTMEKQNRTVYRPETVTATKPEARTVYTPVVEYKWKPRLHGRWNPFQQPTVAYHQVPETRWEARNEVVNRTETRTKWIAENRTVEVPRQSVRMKREQTTELEVVGKVAPPNAQRPNRQGPNSQVPSSAIAARLRPLDKNAAVAPINSSRVATTYSTPVYTAPSYSAPSFSAPRIAASTVGRMTSDPPRRGIGQSGMRANDLFPTQSVRGQALPPSTGGVGIATLPTLPFIR
jgi:hypothetical protein